ncbi:MAG: substrate-binding domain-containing protein [Victivallales bacterium]
MNNKLLYKKISNDILLLIDEGKLLPGDKIPSVSELKVKYQVSHQTVIRAYKEMRESKRIVPKRGCGYFVKSDQKKLTSKSGNIVAIIRSITPYSETNNYFNEVNYGIQDECCNQNLNLIIPHNSRLFNSKLFDNIYTKNVLSGIALELERLAPMADGFLFDERMPEEIIDRVLNSSGKCGVIVNQRPENINIDAVAPDNKGAIHILTDTACRLGYRKFILCASDSDQNIRERQEAFNDFVREKAISANDFYIIKDFSLDPRQKLADKLLSHLEKFHKGDHIAIITASASHARFCVEVLQDKGILPCKNIGIGAIDYLGYSKNFTPILTSVDLQPEQIGRMAVRTLLSIINSEIEKEPSTVSPEAILKWGKTM